MCTDFYHFKRYTEHDDKVIMRCFRVRSPSDIASLLGRTERSVFNRVRRLGLNRSGYPPWSQSEDDTLRRLWYLMPQREVAVHLPGRSISAIQHRRRHLELPRQR